MIWCKKLQYPYWYWKTIIGVLVVEGWKEFNRRKK